MATTEDNAIPPTDHLIGRSSRSPCTRQRAGYAPPSAARKTIPQALPYINPRSGFNPCLISPHGPHRLNSSLTVPQICLGHKCILWAPKYIPWATSPECTARRTSPIEVKTSVYCTRRAWCMSRKRCEVGFVGFVLKSRWGCDHDCRLRTAFCLHIHISVQR